MRRPGTPRQRGAAAVEFALIAPVLLVMMLGMLDLALMVNSQAIVGNASREGARAASFGVNSASQMANVTSAISGAASSLDSTRLGTPSVSYQHGGTWYACSLTSGCGTAAAGDAVKVTVTYAYKWISPALLGLPGTSTIAVTTQMRMETS